MAAADDVMGELAAIRERLSALETEMRMLHGQQLKLIDRLMDAALPRVEQLDARALMDQLGEKLREDVEADMGDWEGSQDWTDPFIQLNVTRQPNEVGRVEAGGSIPYVTPGGPVPESTAAGGTVGDTAAFQRWQEVGQGAFDEWVQETTLPDANPNHLGTLVQDLGLG